MTRKRHHLTTFLQPTASDLSYVADFFTPISNVMVREGGLTASFSPKSNLSRAEHQYPLFSEGKRPNLIRLHKSSFVAIPPHKSSYVLTTFLQPDLTTGLLSLFSGIQKAVRSYLFFTQHIHHFDTPRTGSGGITMSSTMGQIKQVKEELAKLRLAYLKATGDNQELERLATMIRTRKKLLSDLGVRDGSF